MRSNRDWSSDVCSSDLLELLDVREAVAVRVVVQAGGDQRVESVAHLPAVGQLVAVGVRDKRGETLLRVEGVGEAEGGQHVLAGLEIGRASGRERADEIEP